jgi:hypothetical protein
MQLFAGAFSYVLEETKPRVLPKQGVLNSRYVPNVLLTLK